MKHVAHPGIVTRLKRAHGHLAAVLAMFEEGRSCLDLAQQLHAVESAIVNAKRELIEAADLVTEMTLVKHHFAAGVKAQAGIEY